MKIPWKKVLEIWWKNFICNISGICVRPVMEQYPKSLDWWTSHIKSTIITHIRVADYLGWERQAKLIIPPGEAVGGIPLAGSTGGARHSIHWVWLSKPVTLLIISFPALIAGVDASLTLTAALTTTVLPERQRYSTPTPPLGEITIYLTEGK